jgi:hypothetical protein
MEALRIICSTKRSILTIENKRQLVWQELSLALKPPRFEPWVRLGFTRIYSHLLVLTVFSWLRFYCTRRGRISFSSILTIELRARLPADRACISVLHRTGDTACVARVRTPQAGDVVHARSQVIEAACTSAWRRWMLRPPPPVQAPRLRIPPSVCSTPNVRPPGRTWRQQASVCSTPNVWPSGRTRRQQAYLAVLRWW